ncbi:hypothetical protein ACWGLE_16335 [Streptomyces sp. NPDC055897]
MSRFGMRGLAVSIAAVVTVGLLPAVSVAVGSEGPGLPGLKQPKAVAVTKAPAGGARKKDDAAANPWKQPKVVWPAAGSADVDFTATAGSKSAGMAPAAKSASAAGKQRAGSLPVSVGGSKDRVAGTPSKVKVSVADRATAQKAGVDGLLLSLTRTDQATRPGTAPVEVDYSAFKGAYGGDWAARLHLVELPACALTTPELAKCRTQKPLSTTNNTKSGTLSANVPLAAAQPLMARAATGATVLAATAGASGGTGDYKATSLQASGSWNSGGSTGAFHWSYPFSVPSVPGGMQPKMSLGYNSQSVDGLTAASNTQSGWLGDGWSMEPGFIERRYKSCNDDKTGGTNTTKVGDLCWFNDNATMSLNGKNTELVYDAKTGWHAAADSGEKVEKLTGATNGDNDGEHWKVTTTDGDPVLLRPEPPAGLEGLQHPHDELGVDGAGVRQPVRGTLLQRLVHVRLVPAGLAVAARLRRRRARLRDGVLLEHRDQQLRPQRLRDHRQSHRHAVHPGRLARPHRLRPAL